MYAFKVLLACLLVDRIGSRPIKPDPRQLQGEIAVLRATIEELATVLKAGNVDKPHPPPPPKKPCIEDAPMMWPCSSLETKDAPDPTAQFKKVMVVQAHPDDESMGSGLFGKIGLEPSAAVKIVVLTNGDKGTSNTSITSPELAIIRTKEMQSAAAELNATAVFIGYEDGRLEDSYEARLRVAAQIRLFQPDLLVTTSPVRNFGHYQLGSEHKDHAHAGAIALDCFYPLARDHLQFPELWEPTNATNRAILESFPELDGWNKTSPLLGWKVPEAYVFATEQFDHWGPPRYETVTVPLTDHDLERKARSLARHVSQTGGAPWEKLLSGITKRSNVLGAASTPPIEHAEWFTRIMNLP